MSGTRPVAENLAQDNSNNAVVPSSSQPAPFFAGSQQLAVAASPINLAFYGLFCRVSQTHPIPKDCNFLQKFGSKHDLTSWWPRFKHKLTIYQNIYIDQIDFSAAQTNHPLNKTLTAYLDENSASETNSVADEIPSARNFIMRTIRDTILLTFKHHQHKEDGTELIQGLYFVIALCNAIKNKKSWQDGLRWYEVALIAPAVSEKAHRVLQSASTKDQLFFQLIDEIIRSLKSEIEKREEQDEARELSISINNFELALDEMNSTLQSICLQAIFGDKKIPEDIFTITAHKEVFERTPTEEEQKNLEQYKQDCFAAFDGNKEGIHESTRNLVNTKEKLHIIKTLFFMSPLAQHSAEIEEKSAQAGINNIQQQARQAIASSEETSTAVTTTLLTTKATLPATADKSLALLREAQKEYRELVNSISSIMPDAIKLAQNNTKVADKYKQEAADKFVKCTQRLLKAYGFLSELKTITSQMRKIIVGLGNFTKPACLPQLQTLHAAGKDAMTALFNLMEDYQLAAGSLNTLVRVNDTFTQSLLPLTSEASNTTLIIKNRAYPALNKLNSCLRPPRIVKDLNNVVKSFHSVNARFQLLGYEVEISPIFQAITSTASIAMIAAEKHQNQFKNVGDNYGALEQSWQPTRSLTSGHPGSGLKALPAGEENLHEDATITRDHLLNAKVRYHGGLTIGQVLKEGELKESFGKYELILGKKSFVVTPEAFEWIKQQQAATDSINTASVKKVAVNDAPQAKGSAWAANEPLMSQDDSPLKKLEAHKSSLLNNQKILQDVAHKLNPSNHFPLSAFKPSKWWITIIGLVIHIAVIMPIAAIAWLANRKSITASKKAYADAHTAFKENQANLDKIDAEIKQLQEAPAANTASISSSLSSYIPSMRSNQHEVEVKIQDGPESSRRAASVTVSQAPGTPPSASRSSSIAGSNLFGMFPAESELALTQEQIANCVRQVRDSIPAATQKTIFDTNAKNAKVLASGIVSDKAANTMNQAKAFNRQIVDLAFTNADFSMSKIDKKRISEQDKNAITSQVLADIFKSPTREVKSSSSFQVK